MTRLHVSLILLLAASCTVDTQPLCPDEYTPNDPTCAAQYCRGRIADPLCADATAPMVDAGLDARVVDARADAAVAVDASKQCQSASDCPSATPYCLPSGACVACTRDADCSAQAPVCSAGSCAPCTTSSACSRFEDTKVCEVGAGACVACTAQEPTACTAQSKLCKTAGNSCVQCNQSADCAAATAARCDQNACAACSSDDDCTHIAGKPTCNAGTCVACTPASEAQRCGDNACAPDTLTCTSTKRASLVACQACKSDSECIENHRCIDVPFMGQSSGFYCMKMGSTGCAEPFRATPLNVASKNGAAAALYCTHNTMQASCDAVRALVTNKACTAATVATDCGAGGRCETVTLAPTRCTYACSSSLECPTVTVCNAGAANSYCGGP